jgi:hypothetical protein
MHLILLFHFEKQKKKHFEVILIFVAVANWAHSNNNISSPA